MKVPKKIREMPWPEKYQGGGENFLVTAVQPTAEHERYLVVTFSINQVLPGNRLHSGGGNDFRLICSKKQNRVAVIVQGNRLTRSEDLTAVMAKQAGTRPNYCYPFINAEDEGLIARWLGIFLKGTQNHCMTELSEWSAAAAAAEEQAIRDSRGELRDEDVDLCPEELPEGLTDWIRREVLTDDHVLLYKKGNVRGLCYRCKERVRATQGQRFRQHEIVTCPNCGKRSVAYLETSDCFKVDYVANIAAVQKSEDGNTVFIRQWHLLRDSEARWDNVPAFLREVARYGIRGNRVAKWQHEQKENYYMNTYRYRLDDWTRTTDVSRVYDGAYDFYYGGVGDALKGTSLQYCDPLDYGRDGARKHTGTDVIRYFMDWVRYPAIEKFWKAGYRMLVHERIRGSGNGPKRAVQWQRKSMQEALSFPVRLLKIWDPEKWTADRMEQITELWKVCVQGAITESEIIELAQAALDYNLIKKTAGHVTAHRVLKYLMKQAGCSDAAPDKNQIAYSAGIYRDYLEECELLDMGLDDRAVLFPKDLIRTHERTSVLAAEERERRRAKTQREKEKKEALQFAQVVKGLEPLAWEQDGLMIRPAMSPKELSAEGKALSHCVGGYSDRMASGTTAIFFVRQVNEPDKPFYTLELRGKAVVQCRTKHNQSYEQNEAVRAFVDTWVQKIVKTGGKGKKKAVTAA